MKARWLLKVSAVLAWLFAVMLMFNARGFEAPVGIDVTDKIATIAQAQGAILLGLGVINWLLARVTDDGLSPQFSPEISSCNWRRCSLRPVRSFLAFFHRPRHRLS